MPIERISDEDLQEILNDGENRRIPHPGDCVKAARELQELRRQAQEPVGEWSDDMDAGRGEDSCLLSVVVSGSPLAVLGHYSYGRHCWVDESEGVPIVPYAWKPRPAPATFPPPVPDEKVEG